ncbi:MAG TPA: hypothetical protein VFS57_07745, partial [Gemmatimonadaceae bacterium]|nr:hypothetical protein [Gemmatimonadaceae bacterium]
MGVGDTPEMLESASATINGQTSGDGRGGKRGKRAATRTEVEVPLSSPRKKGASRDRRASRERSLNRLLAGLRAVNAGDFSVELAANGDPLMADVIESFNQVVRKQALLVNERTRVSTAVGREGKMTDRVAMTGAGGQWVTVVDSVNSIITDLVQP